MPSFRAQLEIDDVRPGVAPAQVLPIAVAAAQAAGVTVEAHDLEVIDRMPTIWVRFAVPDSSDDDEDLAAREVTAAVLDAVERVAWVGTTHTIRRRHGRWEPLPGAGRGA